MKRLVPLILAAMALVAAPEASATDSQPETIVRFDRNTIVCISKEALAKFVGHAERGEATKANAMDRSKGGPCGRLEAGKKVKVLSVQQLSNEYALDALELTTLQHKDSPMGVWALSLGAQPVKK